MNESYILKSSSISDYSVEETVIAQKTTENFMLYLKNFYDYDEVTLYTYKSIDDNTDISIIDDAIRFIYLAKPNDKSKMDAEVVSFRQRLFSTFKTVQVVCLTRHYDSHSLNHYLFISSYFQNDNFKIIVPMDFNYNLFYISFFNIQYDWSFNGEARKKYLYSNFHQYAEFIEKRGEVNSASFQSVCVINLNVSCGSPILSNTIKNSTNYLNCSRQAQLILKKNYLNDTEIELLYNKNSIKKGSINRELINSHDILQQLDKFIFPLAEENSLIKKFNINPELSLEFMSQDFEPYWLLRDMEDI